VTANSAGNVGISQFDFKISTSSGVTFTNLGLFGYTDSAYSVPISGQGTSGQIGSTVSSTSTTVTTLPFAITNSATPIEVPAGQTYYFELRGTTAGGTTGSSITTTLQGDASIANTMVSTTTAAGNSGYNFAWSPNATTTSTGPTNDWTNGYGVVGLPSGGFSQAITQ